MCKCLHTHMYMQVQPSCPAWKLTNPPLKFKSRIFVGSNTATEISRGVLIQVWIFLRVFGYHDFICLACTDIRHISMQHRRGWWFHHGVGTTVLTFVIGATSLLEVILGSERHRTSFPNCFQEGRVFFLLDFLLTFFLFHPLFFVHTAQQWLMLTLWPE